MDDFKKPRYHKKERSNGVRNEKGNAMKYPNFTHLFFVCVVLAACAVKGLAEPTDQVNQQEVNDEDEAGLPEFRSLLDSDHRVRQSQQVQRCDR